MKNQVLTDDEIVALAHWMASAYTHRTDPSSHAYDFVRHTLLDFSRALLAAERERCARVCEVANSSMTLADCADVIRQGGDA